MEALRSDDPSVVAGYRILARLGSGGMGRVYLARSPGGRPVALKVIRSDFADDPDFRERFAREVAAARAVSGVFTAPVLDADPQGNPPWLATGYVAGVPLDDAISRFGALPDSLGPLAGGLAEALIAVHAAGLVHRDLKPANVILAADGPRLIDFGIARALEGGTITRTGFLVGSPGFLAPEQAGSGEIGPATDVFALGSVLTYAATGQSPFGEGIFTEMLFKVLYGDPDVSGVPPRYRRLLASMLAKDPADRPTPSDILDRLGELGAGETAGAWLPRPLTELVLARSAALLAEDPLAAETAVRAAPTEGPVHSPGAGPGEGPGEAPRGAEPGTAAAGVYRGHAPGGPTGRPAEPTQESARQAAPPPPPMPAPYGSTTQSAGGQVPGQGYGHGPDGPTGPHEASPPRAFEDPEASTAPGGGSSRRRRVVAAAAAVAVLATVAALGIPKLLGDNGNKDNGESQNGTSTGAGSDPSPTGCGALSADFRSGVTLYPQITTENAADDPQPTDHGLVVTARPETDVRADFQGKVTAPFASVPVNGDFAVETRLTVDPKAPYQAAGLLLFADQGNYVRLERGYGDFDAIAFEYYSYGQHTKLTKPFNNDTGALAKTTADTVTLRLEVAGGHAVAKWRVGEGDAWRPLPGRAPFAAPTARAGMTVLNTPKDQGNLSATFSTLRVTCPT